MFIGWGFRTVSLLDHVGPMSASQWPKWLKMVVFDHHCGNYSLNPVETWCVHLFRDSSEMIWFWATLAKVWTTVGLKITENGCVRPLSAKLACVLIGWVSRTDSLLGRVGPISASSGQNDRKWWFPTISGKTDRSIQLKFVVYTYLVSLKKLFNFGPRWPNFSPVVARND